MKTRLWILVAVLGIGAIAVGWIYESRLRPETDRAELLIPDNIDYFLTNMRYRSMTEDGTLDFEFNSRRLEHYPRTDISNIEQPSLQIFRDRDHWQVDAVDGELQHQNNLLWLRRQVVMQRQGDNPMQLYTESIRFEPDRDLISSESSVLMQSKQARIEADRAVFDLAGKIFRFNKTRAVYYNGKT